MFNMFNFSYVVHIKPYLLRLWSLYLFDILVSVNFLCESTSLVISSSIPNGCYTIGRSVLGDENYCSCLKFKRRLWIIICNTSNIWNMLREKKKKKIVFYNFLTLALYDKNCYAINFRFLESAWDDHLRNAQYSENVAKERIVLSS